MFEYHTHRLTRAGLFTTYETARCMRPYTKTLLAMWRVVRAILYGYGRYGCRRHSRYRSKDKSTNLNRTNCVQWSAFMMWCGQCGVWYRYGMVVIARPVVVPIERVRENFTNRFTERLRCAWHRKISTYRQLTLTPSPSQDDRGSPRPRPMSRN